MINSALQRLDKIICKLPAAFICLGEPAISAKVSEGKWSKKEILGHLIDSAFNNYGRFCRATLLTESLNVVPYDQNKWVLINDYQHRQTQELVNLWEQINKHLSYLISKIPDGKSNHPCLLSENRTVTLEWLIADYVAHLEHHVIQIFENKDWMKSEYGK